MINKNQVKYLSQNPGVYIFKDKTGQPLYIGKAKNLKKRIEQYFQNKSLKVKKLLEIATNLEIIETKNEIEAIFKESNLIKKLNPPFNQLLRDDSRYFYLIFTKENLPRIIISHQPEKFKSQQIIGPFFEGSILKSILSLLRRSLPFCSCQNLHNRQCLNAQIGLCYGWCCLKNIQPTKKQIKMYKTNIDLIKKIFLQDLKVVKKIILVQIKKFLAKNNLELASQLKNTYLAIKNLEENQNLIREKGGIFIEHEQKKILTDLQQLFSLEKTPRLIEVCDISHFAGQEKVGIIISFIDGTYKPSLTKKFNIKTIAKPDDPRMIYEVLQRRLKHKEWGYPDIIVVDGGKIQYKFAKQAIKEANLKIKLLALAKPKNEIYYDENKKISLKNYPSIKDFILDLDKKAHQSVLNYHRKKREGRFRL